VERTSGGGVEFQTLGPVELFVAGDRLDLGPARQRAVLAILLVEAGRMVPMETVVDRVWGERPPQQVRNVVYTYVARLRRILEQAVARGGKAALVRRMGGYLLEVDPSLIDLHRFRTMVRQPDEGTLDDEERAASLRGALDLWRGPPLAGLTGDWADRVRTGLVQQRVVALAEWSEVMLRLGRPAVVVEELQHRLTEYPIAETLVAHLMRALDMDGRRAEALIRYAEARHQIAEELGVEPGQQLLHSYEAIVRGSSGRPVGGGTGPTPLSLLPLGPLGFTGRAREVDTLRGFLTGASPKAATVTAISGVGGVGKSALALHVARLVAGQYPDGQLYVDLHGASPGLAPLEPEEALSRFLRALGDDEVKGLSLEDLAARFRYQTATRRLLLVIDNARDAAQVRQLRPSGAGCGVIVTSREVLATLDDVTHIHLDVMGPDEAVALLGRLAGASRIRADLAAATDVADLCGHLPLALRIAAARLVSRPGWPVRALADRLAHAAHRLDELQVKDLVVRSSLAVSHRALADSADPTDRAAADAFPLLGLAEWPDLCLPSVAHLLDRPEAEAQRMLERLVDAQLVQSLGPARYRLHDLLRLYAREEADHDSGAPALRRAMEWYVAATWQTYRLARPGDPRPDLLGIRWARPSGYSPTGAVAALDWLDTERPNLLAIVAQAAETPDLAADIGTALCQALPMLLWVRGHWRDWLRISRAALTAARRAGDRTSEAYGHHDLGAAHERRGEFERAQTHFGEALTIFTELGDRHGEAACLYAIGMIHCQQRHGEAALDFTRRSLSLRRSIGDRRGESTCLRLLGSVHFFANDFAQAGRCHQEALDLYRELGDRHGQATALSNIAEVRSEERDYPSALAHQRQALDIFRELGDRYGQAVSLNNLGAMSHRVRRHEAAVDCYQQALTIFQQLGVRQSEAECLQGLSVALQALGRHRQAALSRRQASTISRELGIIAVPD
jgi:DNA-binding SARP family transcriptional activator